MNNIPIYYSLEAEENRVSRNLDNLIKLVDEYRLPKKPEYILEEIDFLQRELKFLKDEKSKRYYKNNDGHEMAFINA